MISHQSAAGYVVQKLLKKLTKIYDDTANIFVRVLLNMVLETYIMTVTLTWTMYKYGHMILTGKA